MRYDESEFVEAFGIVPQDGAEGHGIERVFDLARGDLRLLVSVFQYDGDLAISIFRNGAEQPIIARWARRFSRAQCIRDPRGDECLEVIYQVGITESNQKPLRERMRIYIQPAIRMTLEYDSD